MDNINTTKSSRPLLVTVILIISFISVIVDIAFNTFLNVANPALTDFALGKANFQSLPFVIVSTILSIIAVVGIVLLWKMKRSGFLILSIATLASVFVTYFFGLTEELLTELIRPIVIILLLSIYYKRYE